MNWKQAKISNSKLKFSAFCLLPTFVVIFMNWLQPSYIGLKKHDIYIASFFLLSLPHFALSIHYLITHKNKEIDFQTTSRLTHLSFIIGLSIWVISFIFFNSLLSLIPLAILFAYQSYHYTMQSYGIYRFFNGKKADKILFYLLGLLFFSNLSLHSLRETQTVTADLGITIDNTILAILFTLFFLTFGKTLIFERPKTREEYIKHVSMIVWFVWVYLSRDLLFLLFLPILHSLQYLPFFQMKLVSQGKKEQELWISHLIINALTITMAFIFLNLNFNNNIQKILLALAISINLIHINVDSYLWKINERSI